MASQNKKTKSPFFYFGGWVYFPLVQNLKTNGADGTVFIYIPAFGEGQFLKKE